jgi:hypothetical protein
LGVQKLHRLGSLLNSLSAGRKTLIPSNLLASLAASTFPSALLKVWAINPTTIMDGNNGNPGDQAEFGRRRFLFPSYPGVTEDN